MKALRIVIAAVLIALVQSGKCTIAATGLNDRGEPVMGLSAD